jgi:phospholipase A1/A2
MSEVHRPRAAACLLWLAAMITPGSAAAQGKPADCVELADDATRLACYDRVHGRAPRAADIPAGPAAAASAAAAATDPPSRLDARWDLDGTPGVLFAPRAYKPVYLLPATWTDQVNQRPSSPSPDHTVPTDLALRPVEAKYQLSLKAKLVQNLFGNGSSLWGGYTQSSRWQVYDGATSRPFRETNYEPELMLVWPLRGEWAGWQLRMASLSINHQSNGRSLPLSRSWNRLIGGLAAERGDWVLEFRPWMRIREKSTDDDNPDLVDYVGRAELLISRYAGEHGLTLQLRHSLRGGKSSRGSGQLDWVFPMKGALHGYLQIFGGYGESLVDYNLRQTKIGLGVTIAGWR